MKATSKKVFRPAQQTPVEIVEDLMQAIRVGFYQDAPKKWFADQHFIKRNIVLWPATWFQKKAVTVPAERYKEIVRALILDIKANVRQEIKYVPAYLMKSMQDHFAMHGDEYYEEAKSIRSRAEIALSLAQRATIEPRRADVVEAMAISRSVLIAGTKRKPKAAPAPRQMSLL